MQNISLIACVSKDMGIGNASQLLWRIPEDMQFFKDTTMGGVVVMGRKTFESIGNPLPGRKNVVLSSRPLEVDGIDWCTDESNLREFLSRQTTPIFIIGGATLYNMFLNDAQTIYLTEVDAIRDADTFFPSFDKSKYLREVLQNGISDGINYEIVKYTKQ